MRKHQLSYYKNHDFTGDNLAFRRAVAAKREAKRREEDRHDSLKKIN